MGILDSISHFGDGRLSWLGIKATASCVLSGIFYLLAISAEFAHPSIQFLASLMCIDFLLAAGIALYEGRFSYVEFRYGLRKFIGYGLAFTVTAIADRGINISGLPLNITVAMSCWAMTGEAVSCLVHIDHIFPGLLPPWIIQRLRFFRNSIEKDGGFGELQKARETQDGK